MNVRHRSPFWRRVARQLGRQLFRIAENNDEVRIQYNGERWLLHQLLRAHRRESGDVPAVVFDVGANIGHYTCEVLRVAHETRCKIDVHVFEPSPSCIEVLHRQFEAAANVRVIAAALADRVGDAELHDGNAGSSLASLVVRPGLEHDPAGSVRVPVARLDDYLSNRALERINLLKLDVEGLELAVLRGAGERLTPRYIDVIQFEYGGTTMDAGTTLRQLYQLLEAQGYLIAKLYPSAVEVRSYSPWMENFAYANYVALSPRWLAERGVL